MSRWGGPSFLLMLILNDGRLGYRIDVCTTFFLGFSSHVIFCIYFEIDFGFRADFCIAFRIRFGF